MATFLFKSVTLALLLQTPSTSAPQASAVQPMQATPEQTARMRAPQDSTDGRAWLEFGRALVARAAAYHKHDERATDTTWALAALDSADEALTIATRFLSEPGATDSAAFLRIVAREERSLLVWELQGESGVAAAWRGAEETDLPPVLEELGENLLRGCPHNGILLTAGELDGVAVGYMRFVRGLRPDVVVIPLEAWSSDQVLRQRMGKDLKLQRLADKRPVCATMAFERPPDIHRSVQWHKRPFLWVSGPRATADQVPPREFVFAALHLATDEQGTWLDPVLMVYRRAARQNPGLCEPLRVYGLSSEVGCR